MKKDKIKTEQVFTKDNMWLSDGVIITKNGGIYSKANMLANAMISKNSPSNKRFGEVTVKIIKY
jgi:hypothetical protein